MISLQPLWPLSFIIKGHGMIAEATANAVSAKVVDITEANRKLNEK
ncbi:hypothetical protein [Desulfoluna limicola]|nr:hypothetical protein [Desulfoluna limicola]